METHLSLKTLSTFRLLNSHIYKNDENNRYFCNK